MNVQQRFLKMPIGVWPENRQMKETGISWQMSLESGLESLSLRLLNEALRWDLPKMTVRRALRVSFLFIYHVDEGSVLIYHGKNCLVMSNEISETARFMPTHKSTWSTGASQRRENKPSPARHVPCR